MRKSLQPKTDEKFSCKVVENAENQNQFINGKIKQSDPLKLANI